MGYYGKELLFFLRNYIEGIFGTYYVSQISDDLIESVRFSCSFSVDLITDIANSTKFDNIEIYSPPKNT